MARNPLFADAGIVTVSAVPDAPGQQLALRVILVALYTFACVIGVDEVKSWYFAGLPQCQLSPTAVNLRMSLAPDCVTVRSLTAAGGRVSVPYRPLFHSFWCQCHDSLLPAQPLPLLPQTKWYPSRVIAATLVCPV